MNVMEYRILFAIFVKSVILKNLVLNIIFIAAIQYFSLHKVHIL